MHLFLFGNICSDVPGRFVVQLTQNLYSLIGAYIDSTEITFLSVTKLSVGPAIDSADLLCIICILCWIRWIAYYYKLLQKMNSECMKKNFNHIILMKHLNLTGHRLQYHQNKNYNITLANRYSFKTLITIQ